MLMHQAYRTACTQAIFISVELNLTLHVTCHTQYHFRMQSFSDKSARILRERTNFVPSIIYCSHHSVIYFGITEEWSAFHTLKYAFRMRFCNALGLLYHQCHFARFKSLTNHGDLPLPPCTGSMTHVDHCDTVFSQNTLSKTYPFDRGSSIWNELFLRNSL